MSLFQLLLANALLYLFNFVVATILFMLWVVLTDVHCSLVVVQEVLPTSSDKD